MPSHRFDCSARFTPLRRLLLAGSTVLAIATSPAQNTNETTAPTKDDVVKIAPFYTYAGFADSIVASTQAKRTSPVIVEAIVAEDLGKLPDTSIADSLARLPGLTTQRVNSRAQDIVIRGLNGDFSTALLNGREQVSTGSGRAVQFDQYPAELLNGVVVYKTAQPSLVGQGLAGTIDLRTARPLALGTRKLAVNTSYDWTGYKALNEDVDNNGVRYSANYIDQFANKTVGLAAGYAHDDQPGQGKQANVWGYAAGPNATSVLGGVSFDVRSSHLKRDSYFATLEYQPNRSVHMTLDVMYSKFNETQRLRGLDVPLAWSGATLQPGYTTQNGLITQGTYTGIFAPVHSNQVWRDAKLTNVGWNLTLGDGSGWVGDIDLSTSRVRRRDNILTLYEGFGSTFTGPADTMKFSMAGDAGFTLTPTLNYGDASQMKIAMPQGWGAGYIPGGQTGYFKGPLSNDEVDEYQVSAHHALSGALFSSVKVGTAYTDRGKWEHDNGQGGLAGYYMGLANGAATAPLPTPTTHADLGYLGIGSVVGFDPIRAVNSGLYKYVPNDWTGAVYAVWDVDEKVSTSFAQLDIATKLGSVPVHGDLGLQGIHTEQTSKGFAADAVAVTPLSATHSYWDYVPSLNLNFDLSPTNVLRFSAARQLARQKMSDMRASTTYAFNEALASSTSVTNSPWSGQSGNPRLEPWRANSLDLSFEHYFAQERGYIAVAGFYKKLVSYTYNQVAVTDFTGFPTHSSKTPQIYQGYRTIPQNGQGGNLRGVEVTLSLNGKLLADALSGFGVIVSGTYIDSAIRPELTDASITIPGLSRKLLNATAYYEKAGFAVRLSSRYRSAYRGDIATFGIPGQLFRTLQAETVYDGQISYTFPKHSRLNGLTILLQGYNLTDEPLVATFGSTDRRLVQDYQSYGPQYSLGASYKF